MCVHGSLMGQRLVPALQAPVDLHLLPGSWINPEESPVSLLWPVVCSRRKEISMAPTPSLSATSVPLATHATTLTEREHQVWRDHEWVLHDPEVQRTYAGSVVAVSNRTILGVGKTHRASLQAAM